MNEETKEPEQGGFQAGDQKVFSLRLNELKKQYFKILSDFRKYLEAKKIAKIKEKLK